jgi:diacylglycerol kinase family enzyme
VPRRNSERAVAEVVEGPALSTGDGLAIIVNSLAGSSTSARPPDDFGADLPDALLVDVGDASLEDAFARTDRAAVLGIVGGDGSINAAAERALATSRPLAVFPGGTLNHFARDLGIDGPGATIRALTRGELIAVDVGLIGGKPFLNTASFGTYAAFVDAREKLDGRLGKWVAALLAAIFVLWRAKPSAIEINGERRSIWMIFIGNCEYQPADMAPTSRARLDDGQFDVRYVDAARPRSRIRFLAALATGRLSKTTAYERTLVPSLRIRSLDGPLRLARDGETFDGGAEVLIEKSARRLAVYAPH